MKSMSWKKRCIHICACVEVYGSMIYVAYLIFKTLAPFICVTSSRPFSCSPPSFPSHPTSQLKRNIAAQEQEICVARTKAVRTLWWYIIICVLCSMCMPVCIHVEEKIYSWTDIFSDRRLQR